MFISISMKKYIAIYLAVLSFVVATVSCSRDDDGDVVIGTSPYAFFTSFGIGNIEVPYHDFTVDGKDTIVHLLVSGDEFEFVVDQKTKEIYNIDSIAYNTKVDKVVTSMTCTGVPYRYDAKLGDYIYFSASDSVDFTNPLSVKVVSTDKSYTNYYTIKLNVHKVDPDLLLWEEYPAVVDGITPVRLLEKGGLLYLFGVNDAGEPVVAVSSAEGAPSWELSALNVSGAVPSSAIIFGEEIYIIANGDVYSSADACAWSLVSQGLGLKTLFAVSGSELWATDGVNLMYSADGASFAVSEPLPSAFPLYGCSYTSAPLQTNKNIIRTTLFGRSVEDENGKVNVWSKLSTDDAWVEFVVNDDYRCPSLSGVQVIAYDKALYALGGAGRVGDNDIKPFESFFVSKDNGIVWKQSKEYNISLPKALEGQGGPFATCVTEDNRIWLVTPLGVWKGAINRLLF